MFWLFILLKIILYILLFIIGLLILLLCIPFNYAGELRLADGMRVRCSVGWAWRLIRIGIEMEDGESDAAVYLFDRRVMKFRQRSTEAKDQQADKKKPDEKHEEKKEKRRTGLKDLMDRSLLNEMLAYLKKLLRLARPDYFRMDGIYGFEDPSLTGMVCGGLSALQSFIPHGRINMQPSFTEEVLEVEIEAEGSMLVGALTYETIRTLLKKPVRTLIFKKNK